MHRNLSSVGRRPHGRHADPVEACATPLKFLSKSTTRALGYAATNGTASDGQA